MMFGTRAELVADLRSRDFLFDELVEDYMTVATALRQTSHSDNESDGQFWIDSLETLHALQTDIRKRLSQVEWEREKET